MASLGRLLLVAIVSLTSISSVAAVPEPDTVALSFNRIRGNDPRYPALRRRQSTAVELDNLGSIYFINVTVGTPPQPFSLVIDTGSSDIWMPSALIPACARYCTLGSYDAARSSTYRNTSYPPFAISYVDGTSIRGSYLLDTLRMGNAEVTNLTMAQATSGLSTSRPFGIMGIGYSDEVSLSAYGRTYPNIIDLLVSQRRIRTRSYSLWLDDYDAAVGQILFGGVDKDKYYGQLVSLPIQRTSASGRSTSFTVALTGISAVVPGQTYNLSPSSPLPVILDSGTTLTYLPNDLANQIFNGVGAVTVGSVGLAYVPCDLANNNLVFSFTFGGTGGARVNVTLKEMVYDGAVDALGRPTYFRGGPYNNRRACLLGIQAAGSNPLLFGDTFLRSAYVVYDLDNNQIGLAQTNFDSNKQNIEIISAGIPDVVSTASAASIGATSATVRGVPATSVIVSGSGVSGLVTRTPTFSLIPGAATVTGGVTGGSSSPGATATITTTATRTNAASSNLRPSSWSISLTGVISGTVVLVGVLFGSGLMLL